MKAVFVDLVERVMKEESPIYRPELPRDNDGNREINTALLDLMKQCWTETPMERPTFHEIGKTLTEINHGK